MHFAIDSDFFSHEMVAETIANCFIPCEQDIKHALGNRTLIDARPNNSANYLDKTTESFMIFNDVAVFV